MSGGRRFLAPEVIQTSAMDCGPAALKSLLEGFGIKASYGRLREACQTSVDGTSIDTLESLAGMLGLEAEQITLPVESVLLAEAAALPALVVVTLPSGLTHFLVVWRVHGAWVQVMDPARGRRWMRASQLLREIYVHENRVDAEAFRAWAESDGFCDPLATRLSRLGVARPRALIAEALAEPGWYVVIQEQPTEPRLGLQADTPRPARSHLRIADGAPAGLPLKGLAWGAGAAQMAGILRQVPTRIAIHASQFLPQE